MRPDVVAGGRFDELGRDAHTLAGFAHASLEHVAHVKFAADLADINIAAPCR